MARNLRLAAPLYFECKKIIERLNLFKDLTLHYSPYAHGDRLASRSIEELIPEDELNTDREAAFRQYINRLIPVVRRDLFYANVVVNYTSITDEFGEEVRQSFDIILEFFEFLRRSPGRSSHNLIISSLDQGIGYYEDRKNRCFWDFFNPFAWLGYIVRIPLIVIEKAGIVPDKDAASKLLKFYEWLIRSLVVLLLALLATKLGISIQWGTLFK